MSIQGRSDSRVVNRDYRVVTECSGRGRSRTRPSAARRPRPRPARRAGRHQLPHRRQRTVDVAASDAAARRRASPLPSAAPRSAPRAPSAGPRTTSSNRFVSSRHTATSRAGSSGRERAQRRRQPLRRLERDDGQPHDDVSRQSASSSPALRGRKPTNAYAPPPRPLATSAVSTADGPGSTVTGTSASSAARTSRAPGSETTRHPGVRDERDALSRLEPRQQLGDARRLVVLVVGEERRGDLVPLEQPARVPRVLREHDVGRAKLVEDAQRDVVEIADRRRADRERHVRALRTRPSAAPISPASPPSSARTISSDWPPGASASRSTARRAAGTS